MRVKTINIFREISYIMPGRPTVKEEKDTINEMLDDDKYANQDLELSDLD